MNTTIKLAIGSTTLIAGLLVATSTTARSQNPGIPDQMVKLQSFTPGAVQVGHLNISGTAQAAYLKGNGSSITGINANNITVGSLNEGRIPTNFARVNWSNDFLISQNVSGTMKAYGSGSVNSGFVAKLSRDGYDERAELRIDDWDSGIVSTTGKTGKTSFYVATTGVSHNLGWLGVYDGNGTAQAKVYVNGSGQGVVSADVKNFVVPNPKNIAEDIVYASLEGPEAAAYVRGIGHLVNGKAHIELPGHFTSVSVSEGMTIQLTPKSPASEGLSYFKESNLSFDVAELRNGKGTYDFAWEAKAVRRMHEDYQPVRKWDEALPTGKDAKTQWNARVQSIEAREAAYTARRLSQP